MSIQDTIRDQVTNNDVVLNKATRVKTQSQRQQSQDYNY